jgi:hypothetical protein
VHCTRQSLHAVQHMSSLHNALPASSSAADANIVACASVSQPPLLPPQAKHALFGGPVVARAHALAAATLAPSNLTANVATAGILADLGLDADTVAAALLTDALDASPLTRPQLEVKRCCVQTHLLLPANRGLQSQKHVEDGQALDVMLLERSMSKRMHRTPGAFVLNSRRS